jgi:hypothetical protein
MSEDEDQLRLLSVFFYILGGLSALCACIPFIHLAVGIALVTGSLPMPQNGPQPPAMFGWLFIVLASTFIIVGWAYGIGMVIAGRQLQRRRAYVFCLVMAALSCLNMPLGTVLGILTLIVLLRPSVKLLFEKGKRTADGSDFGYY